MQNVSLYVPIIKADDEERYILGPVLVPDEEDTQGDIVSAAEIRRAAHRFLEFYQDVRLQHQRSTTVKVVESFIAPHDLQIGMETVKAGTWLLGSHVTDDGIWEQVKSGKLRGYSIGGYAERIEVEADAV